MESIGTPAPPHYGSIFSALLISMVGILATSLAVVVYHLVIVKYCLRPRTDPPPARPELILFAGVDADTLETIPILTYSKQDEGSLFHADQSECAVCLAELEDDDIVRLLPSCRHAFHLTCIDEWFIAHTNCPVCRTPVTSALPSAPDQQGNALIINRSTSQRRINGSDHLLLPQLRRGESCLLPMDARKLKLKRSLSMGHYSYSSSYVININGTQRERDNERVASSSNSTSKAIVGLGRSRSYRATSMRQLDRASSSLRRSFSRLRIGFSDKSNQTLPY